MGQGDIRLFGLGGTKQMCFRKEHGKDEILGHAGQPGQSLLE